MGHYASEMSPDRQEYPPTIKTIYRYVVPIDGQSHGHWLTDHPRQVAYNSNEGVVEFWAEHYPGQQARSRLFQVFGTGHPITDRAKYVGTAERTHAGLVWHLYEVGE